MATGETAKAREHYKTALTILLTFRERIRKKILTQSAQASLTGSVIILPEPEKEDHQ